MTGPGSEGSGGPGGDVVAPLGELSYAEASHELDAIVAYFEQRDVDVDQLVARLERATALVGELDRRLRRTRVQVEQLVPKLSAVLEGAGDADEGAGDADDEVEDEVDDEVEDDADPSDDGDVAVVATVEIEETEIVMSEVEGGVAPGVPAEGSSSEGRRRRSSPAGDEAPGLF